MTAQKNELNNREISEFELTGEQLDQVSGGSMDNTDTAFAMVAQVQAQGVVRSHGR